MKLNLKKIKSFSLVELVIAIGLFSVIVSSIIVFSIDAFNSVKNYQKKVRSQLHLSEMKDALLLKKNDIWSEIMSNTDGPKHFVFNNNVYEFTDGAVTIDEVAYSFTIGTAQRDGTGQIVTSGGSEDVETRIITLTAAWNDLLGNPVTIDSEFYINSWNVPSWIQTTDAEFNTGTLTNTVVTLNDDGEIELGQLFYADWCSPAVTLTSYNLPGQGVADAITSIPGESFIGTGANASGLSFIHVLTDSADPPAANVEGTFEGPKVNDVFGETGYGYITTDTNAAELMILDISALPYVQVGYVDAPGPSNGSGVYVTNGTGYLGQDETLHVVDLSSKVGSRSILGSIDVGSSSAAIRDIEVRGDYAYVSLLSDTNEVVIVDVTNPASMSVEGSIDISSYDASRIYVPDDGSRVMVGTGNNPTGDEFFIIDTTVKSGPFAVLDSYDAAGVDIKGVSYVMDRAILIGSGGQEYQVLDVSNETNITKCGGIDVDVGINDISSVELDGNRYSYIVTNDAAKEFQIIEGGPGLLGGGAGMGYVDAGSYVSDVLDTGFSSTMYYSFSLEQQYTVASFMKFQIRTGDTLDLSAVSWVGPDGTSGTYYIDETGNYIHSSANGHRYFQYKIEFTSDTEVSPVLESFILRYQK